MNAFARLFLALDQTSESDAKVAALVDYFRRIPSADAVWALWFLSGHRSKRAVKPLSLRQWAAEFAELPLWLVDECSAHVGDLAEALALLLPANPTPAPLPLARLIEQRLLPLAGASETAQRSLVRATWTELDTTQRFLWHKLLTGNFRGDVSPALLMRALARLAGVETPVMAHRLLGAWQPTETEFARLLAGGQASSACARPYPFHLASPLDGDPHALGELADWQIEWQWDGVRAQLLRRGGEVMLWSRGEEILTAGFPEIVEAARALPEGTVLDGELVAWQRGRPLPFAELRRRMARRKPSPSLRRVVPVVFMAFEVLESGGEDLRSHPLATRRAELEQIITRARATLANQLREGPASASVQSELFAAHALGSERRADKAPPGRSGTPAGGLTRGERAICSEPDGEPNRAPREALAAADIPLRISPSLPVASWDDVAALHRQARAAGTAGLLLKRCGSAYGTGRQPGAWWKWKVAPFTCHAVLVAAQPGPARRATLYTDFTFALWSGHELVPVARTDSGLTDDEIGTVDAFVRANTTGRFGPVRSVKPELVFELAFDGLTPSTRHKAGLSLRSPRITRRCTDKPPADADSVLTVRAQVEGGSVAVSMAGAPDPAAGGATPL